jgi:hypothetical protein
MRDVKTDAKAIFLEALDHTGADELPRFLEQACGALRRDGRRRLPQAARGCGPELVVAAIGPTG